MPNHTVQYWTEWVVQQNEAFPNRDVPATILIGTRPNGVRITLPSGITASIQWTKGNYCSRRSYAPGAYIDPHDPSGSPDAELAFWNEEGTWYQIQDHDTVLGWQNVNQVEELIMRALHDADFLPLSRRETPEAKISLDAAKYAPTTSGWMSNVEHESRDGQHRIHVVKGKLFFTVMVNDEGLVVDLERDDGTDTVEEIACVRWTDCDEQRSA